MARHLLTPSIGAGVLATVLSITFAGCGGEAPTQEADPVDPAVIEALAADAIRGIPAGPDLDTVAQGLESGSTGFGSGASTSDGFGGGESTDDSFGGNAGTTTEFDSDASTTEVVGGAYPFALNYTNRLRLANTDQLLLNPFANGLAIFSPGSTNEISWDASASDGRYEFFHTAVEFTRSGGYIGEVDSGSMMVTGTSYQYRVPSTSNLVIVLFSVSPYEGISELNSQAGFAIVGNLR